MAAGKVAVSAVVFSGRNGLDFSELRMGVIRIPDVMTRIREAQRILDGLDLPKIDLINVISAGDEAFFRNIKLKGLVAAVVQVGLFDRLMKTQGRKPDYMIGNSNGDSAMLVCSDLLSFHDLVANSEALVTLRPSEKVTVLGIEPMPLLAGISLTEYRAIGAHHEEGGLIRYVPVRDGMMELKKMVASLHEELAVTRFINVGPASALRSLDYNMMGSDDIESLDSIELDPMLSWFWRGMRAQSTSALAQ